jgi:hypothetical protein
MARARCTTCYRPLGIGPHLCPPERVQPAPKVRAPREPQRGRYRRGSRLPRDEYLAQHRTTPEHKLELQRARQARYRARRREQAGGGS